MSNARLLALVAAAALVVSAAGPASADDSTLHDQTVGAGSGALRLLAKSTALAGFAGAGGDTEVQAMYKVPDFTCGAGERSSLLVGVLAKHTVADHRDLSVNGGGGVFLTCADGVATVATALYDSTGAPADAGVVSVGDKVRVTYATDRSASTASSTLENLTRGLITVTGPFDYVMTTDFQVGDFALAINGMTAGPIPAVERITQRMVKVDGKKIKKAPGLTRYHLVDDAGRELRHTSKIHGGGFTVRPAKRLVVE